MESLASENPIRHFADVAGVVSAISRFAANARYAALKRQALAGDRSVLKASMHECVAKNGETFISILHPDNTQFLSQQGLYHTSKPTQSKTAKPTLGKRRLGGLADIVHQLKGANNSDEGKSQTKQYLDVSDDPNLQNKVPERFFRTPSPCLETCPLLETSSTCDIRKPLSRQTSIDHGDLQIAVPENNGNHNVEVPEKDENHNVTERVVRPRDVKNLLKAPLLSEHVQQSFELEEVQSSCCPEESDKKKNPLVRSSSAQSDSSGFQDADNEDISSQTKVSRMESEDSESAESKLTLTDDTIDEPTAMTGNLIERNAEWAAIESAPAAIESEPNAVWSEVEQKMGVGVPRAGRIMRLRHRARLEAHMDFGVEEDDIVVEKNEIDKRNRAVSINEPGFLHLSFDDIEIRTRSKSTSVRYTGHCKWWEVPLDHSYHQVLSLMVKNSPHYNPRHGGTKWPVIHSPSRAGIKKHLVEEVRLMQQALHKYKMEMKSLDLRFSSIIENVDLDEDQREGIGVLNDLRRKILYEVLEMERLLDTRMQQMIMWEFTQDDPPPIDLGGLQVIHQMTELLKEQVYHSTVIKELSTCPVKETQHPLLAELQHAQSAPEFPAMTLAEQISLLKSQLVSSQSQTVASLADSMKDLRNSLVEEIRSSVHCETQQLRVQMQSAEQQLSQLKSSISAPSTPRQSLSKPSAHFPFTENESCD